MTSYYDVFEVAAGVPVVAEDGTSSDLGSGWEHQSNENWSRGWSWHGDARVENENWSWEDPGSDRGSVAWSRQSDGWQRRSGAAWSGWGDRSGHWSWCTWGGSREDGRDSRVHGQATMASPRSPPAPGYDRDGNPPSGEVSSAGERQGYHEPGGEDPKKYKGKVSSSYPPIFRAKPGESYRDWRRSVDFWLGGEGNQIPVEYIGPRIMVQLRDRAAQLVRHLNNEDVNGVNGMAKIFEVLERSPIVKQLDKHRIDQHRKRLMSLSRLAGESLESYITRGSIYRNQLLGLDSSLEMGEKFYIGHLVDHARLTRRDKALVRTRAGEETEESVTNALIELAAELEGEHGFPIGASEPNVAGANGEEHLIQRTERHYPGKKIFGKAALGAEVVSLNGEVDENDTVFGEERSEEFLVPLVWGLGLYLGSCFLSGTMSCWLHTLLDQWLCVTLLDQ